MLIIIHGDDGERARAQLLLLKKEASGKEIRELSGGKLSPTAFIQATQSQSMFGGDVLVVGENILSRANRREKGFAALLSAIVSEGKKVDIILCEEKLLDASLIGKLGQIKVYEFKIPVLIFRFLDSLRPNCVHTAFPLLDRILTREPAEVIFSMLVRRVRQLIECADSASPEGLASWQVSRLTAQARLFTMDELVAMHTKLVEIDVGIKTGASPFTLPQLLEQFVLAL